jgi:anti-sigma factor RsiW
MMDCERASERLGDYVTGDLEPDEWETVREHLETCSACREEASMYLKIVQLARPLSQDGLPEPVEARLRRRFLSELLKPTISRRRGGLG